MMVADEFEKYASRASLYSSRRDVHRARRLHQGPHMLGLAEALGFPGFARELAAHIAAVDASDRAPRPLGAREPRVQPQAGPGGEPLVTPAGPA